MDVAPACRIALLTASCLSRHRDSGMAWSGATGPRWPLNRHVVRTRPTWVRTRSAIASNRLLFSRMGRPGLPTRLRVVLVAVSVVWLQRPNTASVSELDLCAIKVTYRHLRSKDLCRTDGMRLNGQPTESRRCGDRLGAGLRQYLEYAPNEGPNGWRGIWSFESSWLRGVGPRGRPLLATGGSEVTPILAQCQSGLTGTPYHAILTI